MHLHPGLNDWNLHTPLGVQLPSLTKKINKAFNTTVANWQDMHAAGVDLVCANHFNVFDEWLSMPTDPSTEAWRHTIEMIDLFEEIIRTSATQYAEIVTTPARLSELLDRNENPKNEDYRIAVMHALEGGHALGGEIANLDAAAARGVVYITITHFFFKGIASAANSFPFFPDANAMQAKIGLSEFGSAVLQRMRELGIIIDVTHCTPKALDDVLKTFDGRILSSHASAHTLGDHPYGHYDEHLQQIARDGGLVAVILYPYILNNYADYSLAKSYGSLSDIVRTVRYLYKIFGGHKHIAIGSDFCGYTTGPNDMRRISRIYRLREMLMREFDDDEVIVNDIMVDNGIRFILENWQRGTGA
jgi:microsomal dipeptidase-like Zn-dependent dipeptidase